MNLQYLKMDLEKHQRKKIVKYIEKDKYLKLKKYIKDKSVGLNEIITKNGEKMLHVACKEGAVDCLAFLLKIGADARLVDKKGNLPIHLALKFCIENYSRSYESDLVSVLLTYCSGIIKQKNFVGVSVQELLDRLEKVKRKDMFYKNKVEKPIVIDSDSDEEDSEKVWKNKLKDECDYEFEESMGKYEVDNSYAGNQHESFDDWADRIYNAFSGRRKALYAKPKKDDEPSGSKKPKLTLDPNKLAYIQLKENHEKKKYQKMCQKIFFSEEKIGREDIPLKDMDVGKIIDILLDDVKDKSKEEIKNKIREEVRRWHPDKFMQKIGERIVENEKSQVMDSVKAIAQALNSYGK